jgi:molybdate transport system permease protein
MIPRRVELRDTTRDGLMVELWSALWLSVRVAVMATAAVALVGVPVGFWLARGRFWGKSVVEALLLVPLVLPPTVVGYLLVVVLGREGLGGVVGGSLLFTTGGAVVASAVVALPLLLLPAKGAFASVDTELEETATLMGANRLQVFWHVSLPMARRSIGSGLLLAFARALGEFGATVMVLGDMDGRRTLPISVYSSYVTGDLGGAWPAVLLLSWVSFVVVFVYNRTLVRA